MTLIACRRTALQCLPFWHRNRGKRLPSESQNPHAIRFTTAVLPRGMHLVPDPHVRAMPFRCESEFSASRVGFFPAHVPLRHHLPRASITYMLF